MSDSDRILSYPNRPDLRNVKVEEVAEQSDKDGPTLEYPARQPDYKKPAVYRTDGTQLAANTTAVDLIARRGYLAAGDFSNLKAEGLTALDRDLSNASLIGARISESRLPGWNLQGADLSGAHIENCVCTRWDLTGANLAGAQFIACNVAGMKAPQLKRSRLIRCIGIPEEVGEDEG